MINYSLSYKGNLKMKTNKFGLNIFSILIMNKLIFK